MLGIITLLPSGTVWNQTKYLLLFYDINTCRDIITSNTIFIIESTLLIDENMYLL